MFEEIVQKILKSDIVGKNSAIISKDQKVAYLDNFDIGELQKDEVRIRPVVAGVCGTDVKILHNQKPCADGPIGHEASAVVVESLAEEFKRGDFVVVSPHIAEQRATGFYHGNIGYSEGKGILIKEQILHKNRLKRIDSSHRSLYSAQALTQADGLACCIRSQKVLTIQKEMKAAVLGAGTMGILHGQLLESKEAIVSFIDINKNALDMAKKVKIGSNYYLFEEAEKLQDMFDIVIVANGDPKSYEQAARLVKSGGQYNSFAGMFNGQHTIVISGKEVDVMAYHHEKKPAESICFEDKTIIFSGALGYHIEEFDLACKMLLDKTIDPTVLITKSIPLDEKTISHILEYYELGGKIMTYPYFDYIFNNRS